MQAGHRRSRAQQKCHLHGRSSMLQKGSQLFFGLILQSIPGDALESSIHVDVLLGGRLKVGDPPLGCTPLLCLLLCHLWPSRLIRSGHCGIARSGALSWPCTLHMCSVAAVRSACSNRSQSHACSRCGSAACKASALPLDSCPRPDPPCSQAPRMESSRGLMGLPTWPSHHHAGRSNADNGINARWR